jgi:hypothetical protein
VVAINPELRSVLALRFMSVLGVIATLHLVLDTLAAEPWTPGRVLAVLLQAALLGFVLHIRFAAIWEVLCVLAALAAVVAHRIRRGAGTRPLWQATVPSVFLLGASAGFGAYQESVLADQYRTEGGVAHVFWHSVYTGLSYHPDLARKQHLAVNDLSVYLAAERFMASEGRSAEWADLGGTTPEEDARWTHLQYERYDQVVREMFQKVCRERPVAVALAALYYKPRAFLGYAAWLLQLTKAPPQAAVLWDNSPQQFGKMANIMAMEGKYIRPWRWEVMAVLLLLAGWAGASIRQHWRRALGVGLLLFAFSLVPSVLGYPTPHTICDGLVGTAVPLYLATILIAYGLTLLFRSLTAIHPARTAHADPAAPALECQPGARSTT